MVTHPQEDTSGIEHGAERPLTPTALKAIRVRAGLTQSGLAALFRITLRAVQFYEAGDRPIPGPVVYLAELLDAKRIP